MKLYGKIKSERAEEGQGGNDYLDIEITDDKRQNIATIKVLPGEKIKVTIGVNKEFAQLEVSDNT